MNATDQCPRCSRARTSTDPADVCPGCGAAPENWSQPHAANPIKDDDELVVANAKSVVP